MAGEKDKVEKVVEDVSEHLQELMKNPKFKKYYEKALGELEKTKDQIATGDYFQWSKFKKIFTLFNGVEWIKSIKEIIDLRKLVIYAIIVGAIFGYGWYKGKQGTPVKVDIGYGKEAYIELDKESRIHIDKDGYVYLEDYEGNKLKQISVKDVPGLKKKLAPYGLQLEPIGIAGFGVSDYGKSGIEVGAGVSFFRAWKIWIDAFLTNRGAYLGASYKLDDIGMDNSRLGVGGGKGYLGDNRAIVYYSWEF